MSALTEEMDRSHDHLVRLARISGVARIVTKFEPEPSRIVRMLLETIAEQTDPLFDDKAIELAEAAEAGR